MNILVIDDCRFTCDLLTTSFQSNGFTVQLAHDCNEGLQMAVQDAPVLIVVDMMTPPFGGVHLLKRIRANRQLADVPVIALSSSVELDSKLEAFDAGVNDFLVKPFNFQELFARVSGHIRRNVKSTDDSLLEPQATTIGFHSLRGGVGCTSAAVNVALVLKKLWNCNTLLVDAVPWAGQVGISLNSCSQNTWESLQDIDEASLDAELSKKFISKHGSGLDVILAPVSVKQDNAKLLPRLERCISCLIPLYDYIVIDLESTFSPGTSSLLSSCNYLVHVLASNIPSLSAATMGLECYQHLMLENESILRLGSEVNGNRGLTKRRVEKALKCTIDSWLPWSPNEFSKASNDGVPIVLANPNSEPTHAYQDLTLLLSKPVHLQVPPASPSEMWQQLLLRRSSLLTHPVVSDDERSASSRAMDLFSSWF